MKAWVLKGIGQIEYEEVDVPMPESKEVLIEVKNCGICGSDIPRIYQNGAHRHPLVPGHEFSGKISEVGDEVSRDFIGKRVGVFPLIPCKKCKPCLNGHYEMCRDYDYLGSRRDGGFGEYVSVPVWNIIELPDNVSYDVAAMLEPMAVAVHAIRKAINDGTDRSLLVVVYGLGTIGLFILMNLLQMGFSNIIAIGNKDFQREKAIELGLGSSMYIDSRKAEVSEGIDSVSSGYGADIVFECTGKNDTISGAVDIAAPGGTVLLVGNPFIDLSLPKNVYWKVLRNQLNLIGTWNSTYLGSDNHTHTDDWHYILESLKEKKIHPEKLITHKYGIAEIDKGFEIMRDKTESYVKIMMEFRRENCHL